MNIQTYVKEQRESKKNKPTSEHIGHWGDRIVANNFQNKGERGAELYLTTYGKSIGAGKCIAYARLAEEKGFDAFALGFWRKAFSIEHPDLEAGELPTAGSAISGARIPAGDSAGSGVVISKPQRVIVLPSYDEFPEHLRPGSLAPAQPVDGKYAREYYCQKSAYWGQAKRDGEKLIIPVTATAVYYQSRSGHIQAAPVGCDEYFEKALMDYARARSPFILEGEAFYLDAQGNEYMSSTTCANVNQANGSAALPVFVFSPFACLFIDGQPVGFKFEAVLIAEALARDLAHQTASIRALRTYCTTSEKQDLCYLQANEGREGEVWFTNFRIYSGKDKSDSYVRTKHKTPPTVYFIHAVAPSQAAGHYIGGIELIDRAGKNVGSCGTGYSRTQQKEILSRFNEWGADNVPVIIVSQGFTPGGKLRLGVFKDFATFEGKLESL